MSRMFPRGRSPLDPHLSNSLHAAKLNAWAIVVGEPPASGDSPTMSRYHRGMLDDLPPPERPVRARTGSVRGLFAVLGRVLGFGSRPAAQASSLSGASKGAVGEIAGVTYIESRGARDSGSDAPQGTAAGQEISRAA